MHKDSRPPTPCNRSVPTIGHHAQRPISAGCCSLLTRHTSDVCRCKYLSTSMHRKCSYAFGFGFAGFPTMSSFPPGVLRNGGAPAFSVRPGARDIPRACGPDEQAGLRHPSALRSQCPALSPLFAVFSDPFFIRYFGIASFSS